MTVTGIPSVKHCVALAALLGVFATARTLGSLTKEECSHPTFFDIEPKLPTLSYEDFENEHVREFNATCLPLRRDDDRVPFQASASIADLRTLAKKVDGQTNFFFIRAGGLVVDESQEGAAYTFGLPEKELLLATPCPKTDVLHLVDCYNKKIILQKAEELVFGSHPCSFEIWRRAAVVRGANIPKASPTKTFLHFKKEYAVRFWYFLQEPHVQKALFERYGDLLTDAEGEGTCEETRKPKKKSFFASFFPFS